VHNNPAYAFGAGEDDADDNHNNEAPQVVEFGDQYEEIAMGAQHQQQQQQTTDVAAHLHGVAAGTVVYDTSGGDAQYVAREDMAGGAGNVNYEVLDGGGGGGGGAAAPRPGVVGGGAVVVGGRAQLPSSATSNDVYDEASLYASNNGSTSTSTSTSNTAIYEMGPESEQQGQQRGGGGVVVHAPPAYAVPAKKLKSRPDENNTYDMQVPGKKSIPKATAAAAGRAKKKCTRPAPSGGTCTNPVLPDNGQFCNAHACPECGEGKSSAVAGCAAHLTARRPRKQQQRKPSVYNGFETAEDDSVA
jgi:hypothetical protein